MYKRICEKHNITTQEQIDEIKKSKTEKNTQKKSFFKKFPFKKNKKGVTINL